MPGLTPAHLPLRLHLAPSSLEAPWGGLPVAAPSPKPPPWEVLLQASSSRACPRPPGPAHLASGRCSGSEVRLTVSSWAGGPRGRGINVLPQAGPLLRKDMEPSSDQWGHRDLPTCPDRLARPSHMPPSSPRSLGGGAAEVGLLYLGTSDESKKLLVLARNLWAARGLAGLRCRAQGQLRGPTSLVPLGLCQGPQHPPGDRTVPLSAQGPLRSELAQPPFLQSGSGARPGPPKHGLWACSSARGLGWGRDPAFPPMSRHAEVVVGGSLDVQPCGAALPESCSCNSEHALQPEDGGPLPGTLPDPRGWGPGRPPPSAGICRAMTWHPLRWGAAPAPRCGPWGGSGRAGASRSGGLGLRSFPPG